MQFPVNHKACIRHARAFAHLASLDAASFYFQRRWRKGMGAVGYADRSVSCVSPSYALLPFLPPKRIAEGAKAISPDIWRETL